MAMLIVRLVILLCAIGFGQSTFSLRHRRPDLLTSLTLPGLGRHSHTGPRVSSNTRGRSRGSGGSVSQIDSLYNDMLNQLKSSSSSSSSSSSTSLLGVSPREPICALPPLVCAGGRFRTADGTCNNYKHPTWGSAGLPQVRLLPAEYNNDKESPRMFGARYRMLPSARKISQVMHSGDSVHTESPDLTQLFTVWGQFLDHDITHTPVAKETDGTSVDCCNQPLLYPGRDLYWMVYSKSGDVPTKNPNCFPITVSPTRDRFFRGNKCMNFVRSKAFAPSATCQSATREQGNTQTSFIDGSQIYGASLGDQIHLRSLTGGRLKSAEHDLLPRNSTTMCTKRPNSGDFCFGSGDPRVNEHPMLSSTHIVFHRLHNELSTKLAALNAHWDDERLYQEARKILGAILQHMTYAEYLPLVLGEEEMDRFNLTLWGATHYRYDPVTNPKIINSFSTAAFRFGHSMINGLNSYGFHKVNLRDMFFRPNFVQKEHGQGMTMVLNGLIRDHSQKRDRFINTDLTDHLFQTKDGRSLDLASLNIQRGRDHGLPSYNSFRKFCGLPSLQEVMATGEMADAPFLRVYNNLDDVDLFTGGLAETPVPGGVVGPTFSCIIGQQFHNIKFGDRFWYQNTQHEGAFTLGQIQAIERIGLSDVLCWVTSMSAVQVQPFVEPSVGNPVRECFETLPLDLSPWLEI